MEVIVHVGTFKTGTTAIQETLRGHQSDFLKQGLLFSEVYHDPGQHPLVALISDDVPPFFLQQFGDDHSNLNRMAWDSLDKIRRDIKRCQPSKVVISSELFLCSKLTDVAPEPGRYKRLRDLLTPLGGHLKFVCYVRAPAPYYLSLAQQELHRSAEVVSPRPLRIRNFIEGLEAETDTPVLVRGYNPNSIPGWDAVRDFVENAVGCDMPSNLNRGIRANATMSAEAMSISAAYRRATCFGMNGRDVPEHRHAMNLLASCEHSAGGSSKPRLKPEVASAVTRASEDLLWLRDCHEIEFSGVDYDSIDGVMPEEVSSLRRIDEICEVDPLRRDELLMRLLHPGLEAQLKLVRIVNKRPITWARRARRHLKIAASPYFRHAQQQAS